MRCYNVDEWSCFDCPDCGAGCHVSWDECAVCGWEIGFSDWPPRPDDNIWDEWLEEQRGCWSCGYDNLYMEEIKSGHLAGSLVEACSDCEYPLPGGAWEDDPSNGE